MKRALIGGIGNVLLGDDGVGPYVVQVLASRYTFHDNVELVDLGTPALDLTHRIAGTDAVILIDCTAPGGVAESAEPGTVVRYDKADILNVAPTQRLDPHSPALSECLLAAEMLGTSPETVSLVGIVGENFEPGFELSAPVHASVPRLIDAVLSELHRLGFSFEEKAIPGKPDIWWSRNPASQADVSRH